MVPLPTLPPELQLKILVHADSSTQRSARQVSHAFRDMIDTETPFLNALIGKARRVYRADLRITVSPFEATASKEEKRQALNILRYVLRHKAEVGSSLDALEAAVLMPLIPVGTLLMVPSVFLGRSATCAREAIAFSGAMGVPNDPLRLSFYSLCLLGVSVATGVVASVALPLACATGALMGGILIPWHLARAAWWFASSRLGRPAGVEDFYFKRLAPTQSL